MGSRETVPGSFIPLSSTGTTGVIAVFGLNLAQVIGRLGAGVTIHRLGDEVTKVITVSRGQTLESPDPLYSRRCLFAASPTRQFEFGNRVATDKPTATASARRRLVTDRSFSLLA